MEEGSIKEKVKYQKQSSWTMQTENKGIISLTKMAQPGFESRAGAQIA